MTVVDTGCDDIAGKIVARINEYGGILPGVCIRSVGSVKELTGQKPDVLVLTEDAASSFQGGKTSVVCGILLLPGDADADIFDAECIVTYGMSPKNSVTLSSISEDSCVLALQRELLTIKGDVLERQEIKIRGGMPPNCLLAVAGSLLILGINPAESKHVVY